MPRDLQNKPIIITGASSGIGAATAVACAQAGMPVLLNGRNADALDRVANQVRAAGVNVAIVAGDVTDHALNARLLDTCAEQLGGLYAVFANAGYGFTKPFHQLTDGELRGIFEVNFFASCALICAAAQRLIHAQQPGHLLFCSSAAARLTFPGFAAYTATKAAQHHVARSMQMDLAPHNIDVSSVHPVGTSTAFFERADALNAQLDSDAKTGGGPAWMRQPPERVAQAIVNCLRRPRREVWPSFLARYAAAAITAFPRLNNTLAGAG